MPFVVITSRIVISMQQSMAEIGFGRDIKLGRWRRPMLGVYFKERNTCGQTTCAKPWLVNEVRFNTFAFMLRIRWCNCADAASNME